MQLEKLIANRKPASEMLSVLGNPKRLAVLFCLTEGELSFGELAERTGLSQSSLSQQMVILRLLKFVRARRDGHFVHYLLIAQPAISLLKTLEQIYFADE